MKAFLGRLLRRRPAVEISDEEWAAEVERMPILVLTDRHEWRKARARRAARRTT